MMGGYTVGQIVLGVIGIVGLISILIVFLRAREISIPPEFVQYCWIVVAVVVACIAAGIVISFMGGGGPIFRQ